MPSNSLKYQRDNYEKYWGNPEAIKKRVIRNAARRMMMKAGRAKKGDWKDVDHIGWITQVNPNAPSNLRVISKYTNRRLGAKKRNGK